MNLTVTVASEGQAATWPISPKDYEDLYAGFGEAFGWPTVTRKGESYDLEEKVEQRMGEVGSPRREITIEPQTQPEQAPEPIKAPEPQVPVPA